MTTATGPAGNLYLIGFSYTGKTAVARVLAERLGWGHVDTDAEIERRSGKQISQIFRTDGEAFFRELETALLRELASRSGLVVSTGGGIVVDPMNRSLMWESGTVAALEARPETVLRRMRSGGDGEAERPLLQRPWPLDEIRQLKSRRQRHYAEADITVHTDSLGIEEVADAVVGQLRDFVRRGAAADDAGDADVAYTVETESHSYSIVVGVGVLASLGQRLRNLGLSGSAHVIVDGAIEKTHGAVAVESVREAGFPARVFALPPGEASKTIRMAEDLYAWLAEGRTERRDVIVAVGGGVAGDLGGFVAATYARGLPLVQVPTTVLAVADASIGGKVAVDLPVGKNLVGAFHQPQMVLADVRVLRTLPERDRVAGWAEVVKTGLIADPDLVTFLEDNVENLLGGQDDAVRHALSRCAAIKGRVVSLDERETTGLRATLNYGHTLGHAIEAVTNFEGVLHGEAVAVGMSFAGALAARLGRLGAADLDRQERLLDSFGLPRRLPGGLDAAAVRAAISLDKKVEGGVNRWVLLDRIGHAQLRADVDAATVQQALEEFFAGG